MDGPYLFFDFVPTETFQIKRGIRPITVIDTSIHQPDLPTSCNLLAQTDSAGSNSIKVQISSTGPMA